jgi:hypothetical protein
MENMFIFSMIDAATTENFKTSIENGYDLEEVMHFVEDEIQKEKLRHFYPDGKCYIWGEQEKNGSSLSEWQIITEGDLLLGYREGLIVSTSYILAKMDNPSLAIKVWGEYEEEPFRLMLFMTKPHLCEIKIVPQMFKYLDPEYTGFSKLNPEKLKNIMLHYGSLDQFTRFALGQDFPFSLRHSP